MTMGIVTVRHPIVTPVIGDSLWEIRTGCYTETRIEWWTHGPLEPGRDARPAARLLFEREHKKEGHRSQGKWNTMAQKGTPPRLTAKQRRTIEALIANGDVSTALKTVGTGRTTFYRWMKDPDFLQAVHAAEADAVEGLSRMLVRLGRTAVATLARAMSDPDTPSATKVRAADATLSRLLQLREPATLEQRVAALEASVGQEGS